MNALVAKLVDAPDLGSGVEICVGSSPTLGTILQTKKRIGVNPSGSMQ